jgi:[ribosomal protein S5]-alanine N-acetyltransferase
VSREVPSPRVELRRPTVDDAAGYRTSLLASYDRIAEWNPVDVEGFDALLAANAAGELVTFLVVDRADGGLAARVNVSGIARGRFQNASLGYDAFDPYVGTGRTLEGLRLVVAACFRQPPQHGLGLHRLEINVQPDNARSLGLVRRLGFRHEGSSPRLLHLGGAWRDHERFAVTVEEWPLA